MQIAIWAGLGIVAGLIARFSIPRAVPPPPLTYLPSPDDSLGVFVRPASNRRSLLIPISLGMGAAIGGGALSAMVDFGRLPDVGSIAGSTAANAILAAGTAILVLLGYRVVADATGALREIGIRSRSKHSSRSSTARSNSRTAEHAARSLTGELAVAQDHYSIDDDVFHTGREGLRLRKRGVVSQFHVVES